MQERRPQAEHENEHGNYNQREAADAKGPLFQRLVAFHDEPRRREQHVAGEKRHRGDDGEGREPVEGAPGEAVVGDGEALHEGPHDGPLHQSGEDRAAGKGRVPQEAVALGFEAELEGDPAQDEPDQHEDDGDVERRQHDGIGERKGREQAAAAEHEPGLVAVPEGRHRVHHGVAVFVGGSEGEKHAEPEVVAPEQHIEEHGERKDRRPDQWQDHGKELGQSCAWRCHRLPEAAMGRCER